MKYQAKGKFAVILLLVTALLCLFGCEEGYEDVAGLSAVSEESSVIISWQAIDSANNYRLYRKKESDGDYRFLADTLQTDFTDSSVSIGEKYRYKLQVVYKKGVSKGVVTDVISVADKEDADVIHTENNPIIESVTRLDKYTAVILLDEAKENVSYEVLRSENEGGEFQVIGTTESKVYYDTTADDNIPYYYIVCAKGNTDTQDLVARQIGYNSKNTFSVPVLMYHEFVTQEDLDSGVAFDQYAIWQSELEDDLIWLKENGYNTITSKQLIEFIEGNGTLPEKPIILSIGDGKYGVYKRAYPMLQKYGMKMSLAIIGSRIDAAELDPVNRGGANAPYSTWSEIGEMSRSGYVEITSHTYGLHVFHNGNRQGANTSADDTLETFLPVAQRDCLMMFTKIKNVTDGLENYTLAYPYSKRSVLSDTAWLKSGYKLLFGGDDSKERRTYSNYFITEAGLNRDSALMRRIPRMTGTPISEYLKRVEEHDSY